MMTDLRVCQSQSRRDSLPPRQPRPQPTRAGPCRWRCTTPIDAQADKPVPQAAVATDLQVCRFRVRRTAPLPDRARPQPPSRIGRDPQDPQNGLRDPRRNNMFEKYRHKTSPHTVWFEIKAMECSPNPGLIQPGAWTSVSTPLGVQQKITAAMGNAKPWIYNPREPQRTSLHPRQRHDVGYSHSP